MKSFYLIVIALIAITVSCKTKDGAPGPKGQIQYTKQGRISGTVTFTDKYNKVQNVPFNYEYYGSLSDSKIIYDTISNPQNFPYNIHLKRLDLVNDNFLEFNISGSGVSNVLNSSPANNNFNFQLNTVVDSSSFYTIKNSNLLNTTVITKLDFDFSTNHLTFDYTAKSINYGGAKNDGTMRGKVDVILNHGLINNNLTIK